MPVTGPAAVSGRGRWVAGTVARGTGLTQLRDGYLKDEEVISAFTGILAAAGGRFGERLHTVGNADQVTANLLAGTLRELEKAHWMFQAQQ
jgi:starvation-inducible DNA-binding protein